MMPAAVAVPVGLAVAGMVAQNVQNKAAIKNNDTQQAGAKQNAANATKGFNNWVSSNPSPLSSLGIAGPPTITNQGYQPGNVNASAILNGASGVTGTNSGLPQSGSLASDPHIAALIAQIMHGITTPGATPTQPANTTPPPNQSPPLRSQLPRFRIPLQTTRPVM